MVIAFNLSKQLVYHGNSLNPKWWKGNRGSCPVSADGSKWKKTEKVNSSQSFYQLQGLTPGSHYRLRFTYSNTTFWETDIETEGTGAVSILPSFILFPFIFSAPSSGLPTSKYNAWSYRVSSSFLHCLWSAFKDLCEKRVWLAIWNDPLLVFVWRIVLYSLVPMWNATLSESSVSFALDSVPSFILFFLHFSSFPLPLYLYPVSIL